MKDSLKPGVATTVRYEIDAGRTIDFMGEAMRVYSTPNLVHDIEATCRNLLLAHSDEGEDSVGVNVNIDHTGATLMGMWVDITATVTAVEGPKVVFEVTATDEVEQVGHGSHVRFSVPVAALEKKMAAKMAQVRS